MDIETLSDLELEVVEARSIAFGCSYLKAAIANFPVVSETMFCGIDPGRNFGLCIIGEGLISVHWGTMPKGEWPDYAKEAFKIGTHLKTTIEINMRFAIEGAAHRKGPGQAGLAGVRYGFYLGLHSVGETNLQLVPPSTARKVAFGHGKTKGGDIWPLLNSNAADAIGLALWAAKESQ